MNPETTIIGLLDFSAGSKQDYLTPFVFSGKFVVRKAKKVKYQNSFYTLLSGEFWQFSAKEWEVCQDVILYIDRLWYSQMIWRATG